MSKKDNILASKSRGAVPMWAIDERNEKRWHVIKTEHLSHVYSGPLCQNGNQDVNLSIEEGEFVGVIGHTGWASPR